MVLNIDLTDDQIISLLRQLPADRRESVVHRARAGGDLWSRTQQRLEPEFHRLAQERGRDWDAMDDDEKLAFTTDLDHAERGL